MMPTKHQTPGKKMPASDIAILSGASALPDSIEREIADALPPRDRGRAAWTCLAAISAISMSTWGFGATQGVFREYYFKNPPFQGNQLVASIGLLVVGILQSLSPFLLHLIGSYPESRQYMMWVGMVLVVASSLGAAFSTTALQVIMTQGLMYGLSSGLLFAPCISFVDEWFLQRRGLANGIFFGSANIASAALSPIFARLLQRFGPRTTLIGWTLFIAITISIGILCIRTRPTQSTRTETGEEKRRSTFRPFKSMYFWLFVFSMAVQSLANNLPANYLPSYATDLGVDSTNAALLVTYLSLSGIVGQVSLGALTDAIGPLVPMLLSTLISSFAVLLVWGLGKTYWTMVIVSVLFGAFAFSFMVLRSHMAAIVVNDSDRPAEELLVSGVLLFTRGIVGVVSGYIAAAVLQSTGDKGVTSGYGAGKWRTFIILLGTTMTAATIGVLGLIKKKTTS
ncbi:major facilitator superfamily domain-containing protein [Boeremia exigua]|uniref:major facilitator superfamily domain-containing protein n=1 Tax=Boeremia exigua TaxID=749465 RepID=UPI001E8D4174|nr:major facilitator superfamily domain-containing protein [Boeremia exigua]KAH6639091.1 major facilitator superfamily domain-containing protein [Boeremia exigua]